MRAAACKPVAANGRGAAEAKDELSVRLGYTFTGLLPNTLYRVTVKGSNKFGLGTPPRMQPAPRLECPLRADATWRRDTWQASRT